jgi:hypothetical protein
MAASGGISAETFTTAGRTRLTIGDQLGKETIASFGPDAAPVAVSGWA